MKRMALLIGMTITGWTMASAQIREIPKIVMENFTNQYPKATDTEFRDLLVKVEVSFELEGENMLATYTNKGIWKGSEKELSYDTIPEEIKTGFEKSKYAEWDVTDASLLYLPGGSQQYRVLAEKSGLQKKYLFFNTSGRLLRESITL